MDVDGRMMRRALALAALGRGGTSPNPMVGAVVVAEGRVVGQGYHRKAGEPHAEVFALGEAGRRALGATLYTNLEPCCHIGRTPPCVDRILSAGVTRVVAAMRDPDPRVDGGGVRALRRAGVRVEIGLLREEAVRLNQAFIKYARTGLPFVTLKGAASLDGRIATRTGESKWITSPEARKHSRLLRREHDAVIVGIGTVLADDPLLTPRPFQRPLTRVVMDTRLRLPLSSRLVASLKKGPVVVFCGPHAARAREHALTRRGVDVRRVGLSRGKLDIHRCLESMGRDGLTAVLVEGGSEIHASFVERGLADRLVLYIAPKLIGGREARPLIGGDGPRRMTEVGRLRSTIVYRVGDEIVVEARLSPSG